MTDLRHGFDGQPGGCQPSRRVQIRGWCFDAAAAGDSLKGVRARVGEAVFKASRKQTRWGVARQFPDFPQAQKSGFTVEVVLPVGSPEVILEARAAGGEWVPFATIPFQVPRFQFLRWLIGRKDRARVTSLSYAQWAAHFESPDAPEIARLRERGAHHFAYRPLISFVVPARNPNPGDLLACLNSLLGQAYNRFEICIADDGSTDPQVLEILRDQERIHPDVAVSFREFTGDISAASNAALALATGEFIALVGHDGVVAPHALFHVVEALQQHPEAVLLYSDEDMILRDGSRIGPQFKPDFDPELLRVQNCVSRLGVYRTAAVRALGGFREGMDGTWDWDLALRVTGTCRPEQIVHIPRVLYHRTAGDTGPADGAPAEPYDRAAAERVVREHLQRAGFAGASVDRRDDGTLCVRYPLPTPAPQVAIIVPTRDQPGVLERCLRTLATTEYPRLLTVIVDNGTTDPEAARILTAAYACGATGLRDPSPFNFARLCNAGAAAAAGLWADLLVFLNNDTEITEPTWLEALVRQAVRPEVGAVGARLLYPDGTLQHAGVFLGFQGAAGHRFRGLAEAPSHSFQRDRLAGQVSAVTAACLAVEVRKFDEVGGMDAEAFAIAYNDVDLCLRLARAGYRTLYEPAAVLVHHESQSRADAERSPDQKARANREIAALQERWGDRLRRDPFHNPNLDPDDEAGTSFARPPGR
ncbi:N/A [soil metagenome]